MQLLHDITAYFARQHFTHDVLLRLLASPSHAVDCPAAQTSTSLCMLAIRLMQSDVCEVSCNHSTATGVPGRLAKHGEAFEGGKAYLFQ